MAIQQLDKRRTGLRSKENDLFDELKSFHHLPQIGEFRSISDDGQFRQEILLSQQPKSGKQNIDPLVSNQAAYKNQIAIADLRAVPAKQIVTIRIANDDGGNMQMIGNRLAHRDVSGKPYHELLKAIPKSDGSIWASDPCMVGDYPGATDQYQRPIHPKTDVIMKDYLGPKDESQQFQRGRSTNHFEQKDGAI
jgi:hypothetical protein